MAESEIVSLEANIPNKTNPAIKQMDVAESAALSR